MNVRPSKAMASVSPADFSWMAVKDRGEEWWEDEIAPINKDSVIRAEGNEVWAWGRWIGALATRPRLMAKATTEYVRQIGPERAHVWQSITKMMKGMRNPFLS